VERRRRPLRGPAGAGPAAAPRGEPLRGDAFWNTFWNLNGLWSLVSPEILNNWVLTELELYDATGWTSNGPTGVEMTGIMEVSHEIALLVAAYQKGSAATTSPAPTRRSGTR
jgi:putative alpha-1,2-mannosidase